MENTISIRMENLSDTEREQLMKLVEKANNNLKSGIWKPQEGESVYICFGNGTIYQDLYSCNYRDYLEYGLLFQTREEAEFEVRRRKILKHWKDLSIESGEEENPWDGENQHWVATYDYYSRDVVCDAHMVFRTSDIYFSSKMKIISAIEEIGEENVKKYILNIKE